jgi:hypothetical protein
MRKTAGTCIKETGKKKDTSVSRLLFLETHAVQFCRQLRIFGRNFLLPSYEVKTEVAGCTKCLCTYVPKYTTSKSLHSKSREPLRRQVNLL